MWYCDITDPDQRRIHHLAHFYTTIHDIKSISCSGPPPIHISFHQYRTYRTNHRNYNVSSGHPSWQEVGSLWCVGQFTSSTAALTLAVSSTELFPDQIVIQVVRMLLIAQQLKFTKTIEKKWFFCIVFRKKRLPVWRCWLSRTGTLRCGTPGTWSCDTFNIHPINVDKVTLTSFSLSPSPQ